MQLPSPPKLLLRTTYQHVSYGFRISQHDTQSSALVTSGIIPEYAYPPKRLQQMIERSRMALDDFGERFKEAFFQVLDSCGGSILVGTAFSYNDEYHIAHDPRKVLFFSPEQIPPDLRERLRLGDELYVMPNTSGRVVSLDSEHGMRLDLNSKWIGKNLRHDVVILEVISLSRNETARTDHETETPIEHSNLP